MGKTSTRVGSIEPGTYVRRVTTQRLNKKGKENKKKQTKKKCTNQREMEKKRRREKKEGQN